jgi:hypothetical protein
MNRARISRLESALAPEPPCILGATLDSRTGQLRRVLYNGKGTRDAPTGLVLADLPSDCLIYSYDPSSECAFLFQSTADGRAHVQRVLGVNEDTVLGRDMDRGQQ